MKACLAQPLERLTEAVQEFTQRPELRIMHVAADGHLRSGALRVLLAAEHLADNRSPWVGLQVDGATGDWDELEVALTAEHARLRALDVPLSELSANTVSTGAGRFAVRLRQCALSVCTPASGFVLLLICEASQLQTTWLNDIRQMAFDPALEAVRFVLMTSLGSHAQAWSQALPTERSLIHRCVIDPEAAVAELQSEIDAEARHGPGEAGAWPVEAEPPAPHGGGEFAYVASVPVRGDRPSVARSRTPAPVPETETLRLCIKRAVLAMRRSDGPEAVRQQTRARDLCVRDGQLKDAVRMELVLGGYLLELAQTQAAQASFGRAADSAQPIEAYELEAKARYAEAWVWRQQKNIEAALRSYWAGIEAAKRGEETKLAFDGYWDAGQTLRPHDRSSTLISLWTDAVSYANTIPAEGRQGTRIVEIAQALTHELDAVRRTKDARSIERWAEAVAKENDGSVSR